MFSVVSPFQLQYHVHVCCSGTHIIVRCRHLLSIFHYLQLFPTADQSLELGLLSLQFIDLLLQLPDGRAGFDADSDGRITGSCEEDFDVTFLRLRPGKNKYL